MHHLSVAVCQVTPTTQECGNCDAVYVDEVGDTPVVVFKQGVWRFAARGGVLLLDHDCLLDLH